MSVGVVELRRYTLHPGARETLIELFERELVEPQEATGMRVLGQFRDLDHPDVFTWLRGFRDMPARARALAAFYGGPVWRKHRDAANATMVDSDDVLLLRPVGAAEPPAERPGLIVVTTYHDADDALVERWERERAPALRRAGAAILGRYRTEHSPNDFPALPVREGEDVFVTVVRFEDEAARVRASEWSGRPRTVFRLEPTARSRLR